MPQVHREIAALEPLFPETTVLLDAHATREALAANDALLGMLERWIVGSVDWEALGRITITTLGIDEIALLKGHRDFVARQSMAGVDCELLYQVSDQRFCRRVEQQAESVETALLWVTEHHTLFPTAHA